MIFESKGRNQGAHKSIRLDNIYTIIFVILKPNHYKDILDEKDLFP